MRSLIGCALVGLAGCTGLIADPGASSGSGRGDPGAGVDSGGRDDGDVRAASLELGESQLDRLTVRQLEAVLYDLLGDRSGAARTVLPGDSSVFSDTFEISEPSNALVEGLEGVLSQAVGEAMADPARRAAILGCEPTGPADGACAREYIERFGRRALRRPLREEEVAQYLALHEEYAMHPRGSFTIGADTVVRALLLHPEVIYHVEVGEPTDVEGIVRLTPWEIASRLSFFLWGTAPDDWLLDIAAAGELATSDQRRAVATMMLDNPRARAQLDHFHAAWLGYDTLPHDPDLVGRMRTQTRESIHRVVFDEQRSWLDLFRLEETFIDDTLAEHYGLPVPGSSSPVWIDVAEHDRGGILAHGSYLSIEGKFDDTSPVQRGHLVSSRLMCLTIPEPDATLMVNVDEPPPGDGCKPERYVMHSQGGCASCHQFLDPVGMGLEAYDTLGRLRTHEPDRPDCAIEGVGAVPEVGAYRGPVELGEALITSGKLESCAVTQVYRFAAGRRDLHGESAELERLTERFRAEGYRLDSLILELVASPELAHRRLPAAD